VSTPTLAAITLAETGGGVAAVSRLIWNVMGERWTTRQLVTLDAHQPGVRPRVRGRIKFGLELGSVQASHPDSWVLFSHLSLARAHAYLPTFVRRPYGVFLHGIEAWRPLGSLERGLARRRGAHGELALHGPASRARESWNWRDRSLSARRSSRRGVGQPRAR
jgi:hypothetical protein